MKEFFNYITRPVSSDEVEVWFRANNIIFEKLELFSDFSLSLYEIMMDTYLGIDQDSAETRISLTQEDNDNHFKWCWEKVLSNFEKEGITFIHMGEHFEYFQSFFTDTFYDKEDPRLRDSIGKFFNELFSPKLPFTSSDLDMVLTIYRLLDKNIIQTKP